MTTFESSVSINRTVDDVYEYLSDFNNHHGLMPDTIQNWNSTFNEASFDIPNMAHLSLKINERHHDQSIHIIAIGNPPFDIKLTWNVSADSKGTAVNLVIAAELSVMMKMLASVSLQKLADHEVSALAKLLTA
jgi:carbon monoxide dehydrogenase subunit G